MNTQDETAEDSVAASAWYGFDRLRLSNDATVVDVTIGSRDRWDKAHLRRLRQSADLPGLVPVIDADVSSDGKPFAVTPAVNAPTLGDRIPAGSDWSEVAGITEAAARATHEAHLRGLFHGALSPDQIFVLDNDVAVSGIGLGLGGVPRAEYGHWVSPEVQDAGDATERSDVYSLGKILEAALGDSLEDVPRSVRRLIMWSGSDTPEARPPTALEFASILAEALGENRKIYGPAFIPTTEANDLASTASEKVASHVVTEAGPAQGSGSGVALGGAAAAGAMAMAAPSLFDDEPSDEADAGDEQVVETVDEVDADVAEAATDEGTIETESIDDVADDEADDVAVAAPAAAAVAAGDASVTRQLTEDIDLDEIESAAPAAIVDTDDDYEVPAAAQTVDLDRAYEPQRRSSWAGILIGAILAAGLAFIAWNLLRPGDDTVDVADGTATTENVASTTDAEVASPSTAETESSDTATGEATATGDTAADDTAADDTATTDSTEATDTASTEAQETGTSAGGTATTAGGEATTSESSTTESETSAVESGDTGGTVSESSVGTPVDPSTVAALIDGPIAADKAGIQLVHGVPGVPVDLYVDGAALVPNFTPGSIAGPVELTAGSHQVDLYATTDSPSAAAADRSDEPLVSGSVTAGTDPATIVAHLDADGTPVLSTFADDVSKLGPGKGRLVLRHLAAAPAVDLAIDGEPVAGGAVEPGGSYSAALAAGSHDIVATDADGTVVQEASLTIGDGEMATVSVIGSVDSGLELVVQRITGLSSAPSDVPTGTGGLLDVEDRTGMYLLAVLAGLMAVAGGLVLNRRNRVL